MDVDLIEIEPHISGLWAVLLILGSVGYLAVRRWPSAMFIVLAIVVALVAWLAVRLASLFQATSPEIPGFLFVELALVTGASLVAIALPLIARRRARSRPAA